MNGVDLSPAAANAAPESTSSSGSARGPEDGWSVAAISPPTSARRASTLDSAIAAWRPQDEYTSGSSQASPAWHQMSDARTTVRASGSHTSPSIAARAFWAAIRRAASGVAGTSRRSVVVVLTRTAERPWRTIGSPTRS